MTYQYSKFYQLGNGENLVFERDLEELSEYLERPFPEFFGAQLNDQPGGQLQWQVVADLRGKMEPPTSQLIRFSVRENNWMDGLARAMQEALARLCGQNVNRIRNTRFIHYARHDSMGDPMDMSPHPELKHHVDHMDYMLQETRKELDNARAQANADHIVQAEAANTITLLASDRRSLRRQRTARDTTITRLRAKIAAQEQTIADLENMLEEVEEEGIDLRRENDAFLSDDDDYLEEQMDMEPETDEDDDDFIDDDDEEGVMELMEPEEEDPEEIEFEEDEPEIPDIQSVEIIDHLD
jgi:hypothetical protein